MATEKRIAIIGSPDTVLPFKAVGLDGFPAVTSAVARDLLDEVAAKGYGIIYIEEAYARDFYPQILELNRRRRDTAVTIIPGSRGSQDFAGSKVRSLVKKAIGLDIFPES